MQTSASYPKSIFIITLLVGFLSLAACSEAAPEMNPALDAYAMETLTPGEGLGDIELDRLTFSDYIARFGMGTISKGAHGADPSERIYDFYHNDGQVSFMFRTFDACRKAIQKGENYHAVPKDTAYNDMKKGPDVFFEKYPDCKGRNMRLHSIAVTAPRNLDHTWFKGSLGSQMEIFSQVAQAKKQMGVFGDILNAMNHDFVQGQGILKDKRYVVSGTHKPLSKGTWYGRGMVIYPTEDGQGLKRVAIFPKETNLEVWQ